MLHYEKNDLSQTRRGEDSLGIGRVNDGVFIVSKSDMAGAVFFGWDSLIFAVRKGFNCSS